MFVLVHRSTLNPRPPQIHTHHSVFCNENKTKKQNTTKKLEPADSWIFRGAFLILRGAKFARMC